MDSVIEYRSTLSAFQSGNHFVVILWFLMVAVSVGAAEVPPSSRAGEPWSSGPKRVGVGLDYVIGPGDILEIADGVIGKIAHDSALKTG